MLFPNQPQCSHSTLLYNWNATMQHNALQWISHSMKISFCEILYQQCATIQSNSLSSQLLSLSCGTMMVAPRRAFTSGLGCFTCVGMSLSMKEPSKYKMNASALIQWLGANSTEVCIHEVSVHQGAPCILAIGRELAYSFSSQGRPLSYDTKMKSPILTAEAQPEPIWQKFVLRGFTKN